ncbi:MAG: hypothetical protein IPP07_16175 [Holophagales bacterium]|nr:hypothetical protein [Holophagales bacterium]
MGGRTVFSRVSGGIVLDSFSIVSFFTGLLAVLPAGLLLLVSSSGPRSAAAASAVSVVWGVTVLLFVSRFAQLGIAGDSEGGLFSESAGPWSGTVLVAVRLFVLWVLWAIPFVAWAFLKGEPQAPAGFPGMGLALLGVPRIPILLAIWAGLGMVLSFAFVAVAAAAPGFGDLFSPGLWRELFSGRFGELFVAIAGTYGPPVSVLVVFFPLLVALVPLNPKGALTGTIPFFIYAVGMVLSLQGKLCGAYAAASVVEEGEVSESFAVAPPAEAYAAAAAPASPVPVHTAAPGFESPAPVFADPKQLHAAWRSRLSAGDLEGALEAAREAIPAGLAKKEPKLAAEMYRRHLDRLPELGLDRTELDLLADQLLRDGDVAAAAWTFSQALDTEPTDPKAFKGLLRVAEHHLEKAKEPLEAIRVYRYLLERAPASPFADHARDLLGAAERRAARPATPQG